MTFETTAARARRCVARAGAPRWRRARASIPRELLKPLADSWPTYNGDYSGKRYSPLTQINRADREEPDARVDRSSSPAVGEHGAGGGGGRGGGGGGGR